LPVVLGSNCLGTGRLQIGGRHTGTSASDPNASAYTLRSFTVETGHPGISPS
jgi:hypothetical protein